jgi:RNA polymerase sigma-70 factor (ECF subfamily)
LVSGCTTGPLARVDRARHLKSERNAQESIKQKAKVNYCPQPSGAIAGPIPQEWALTPRWIDHRRAAGADDRVDVWQTRVPWPATLAMGGADSERPDASAATAPTASAAPAADLASLDDRALVARAAEGDRAAFDVLVRRHQRAVYGVCYRFTHDHAEASDLAQDALVRAYRGLARFKGDAAFGTWLYRIAVNVCLTRAAVKTPPVDPIEPLELADTRGERPDDPLRRSQDAARVKAAIARLPEKQRLTVILRVYHELPHDAIARTLGSTVGTVKANFFHALQNLRRFLEDQP